MSRRSKRCGRRWRALCRREQAMGEEVDGVEAKAAMESTGDEASHSILEAKEVFVQGINRVPCKPLIKGLIQFMSTHGGPTEIPLLDSVISNAVAPGSDVEPQVERDIVDSGGHNDSGEHKALENLDSNKETSRTSQECTDMVQSQHRDKYGIQNQTNSYAKEETNQDLSLHEQNYERTSHEARSSEAPAAESVDCASPSKAIASSETINSQDNVTEASASSHQEILCSKSDLPCGSSMPKEGSSSDPARISPELEERQPVEVQDGRNKQMDHGQQSEASQSDGSKLRSGEQSELSYPSTPQSQR
nr:unnamed protein product [Digitaria exilis]